MYSMNRRFEGSRQVTGSRELEDSTWYVQCTNWLIALTSAVSFGSSWPTLKRSPEELCGWVEVSFFAAGCWHEQKSFFLSWVLTCIVHVVYVEYTLANLPKRYLKATSVTASMSNREQKISWSSRTFAGPLRKLAIFFLSSHLQRLTCVHDKRHQSLEI